MAQPLLTILLASIFLANERNFAVVVAAIIAGVALIVSRINHEHLEFNNASIGLIFAVVLMSVELILIDLLLPVLSPVALYAVRTGLIAIFFFIYYRPRLRAIADHHYGLIAATSALGVAQMVSKFYGFQEFGVVYTSLILVLAPVIVYIVSTFWLHERLKPRTLACSIVILACVLYATVMGQ
jgi:drug/metabolite transporter (DMT)-like permease